MGRWSRAKARGAPARFDGGNPGVNRAAPAASASSNPYSTGAGDNPAEAGTQLPSCVLDAGVPDSFDSLASGNVEGAVAANLCLGGTYAFGGLVTPQPGSNATRQFHLLITGSSTVAPSNMFQFRSPANAVGGEVSVEIAADYEPGTYPSSTSPGSVVFTVFFPEPAGLDCNQPVNACPAGCEVIGLERMRCQPISVEMNYEACSTADYCTWQGQPFGSYTLTLTSVEPTSQQLGQDGDYEVHGALSAKLAAEGDAGVQTATMTILF